MKHQFNNSKATHYSGIIYQGSSFEEHFHNSYEMICVIHGSINVSVNTESLSLSEKDCLFISPCMVHGIRATSDSVYFIAIITPDYIPDFYETHKKDIAYIFSPESDSFDYLQKNLFEIDKKNIYKLKSCLYLSLSFVDEKKRLLPPKDTDSDFIRTVNSYIAEHFTEPISRAHLAAAAGYEEHYFSSVFQKNFRMNLKKYINTYRISYALSLLRTTDAKIGQIAMDCGFSSVKEFNNVFMALMNKTPSRYRSEHA